MRKPINAAASEEKKRHPIKETPVLVDKIAVVYAPIPQKAACAMFSIPPYPTVSILPILRIA